MPIPKRKQGEPDDTFISRCIEEISGEYDVDQAAAICYSQLELEKDIQLIADKDWRRTFVNNTIKIKQ
jgi:hypothetical protein